MQLNNVRLIATLCLIFLLAQLIAPTVSLAQALTWTQADIGSVGTPGTYSYSSGTYTVGGSGTGPGGTSDNMCTVTTPVSGSVEITARLNTQGNTDANAFAGIILRQSTNSNSPQIMVGVRPGTGVVMMDRVSSGQSNDPHSGTATTAPVWLKLQYRNGVAKAFESADGLAWSLIFKGIDINLNSTFLMGFAVSSNVTGLSTATFDKVVAIPNLPPADSSMVAWYRADDGITLSGTDVSQWTDSNKSSDSMLGGTGKPTYAPNSLNGLPTVHFDGTQWFFRDRSSSETLSAATVFAVTKGELQNGDGWRYVADFHGAMNLRMQADNGGQLSFRTSGTNLPEVRQEGATTNEFQVLRSRLNSRAGVVGASDTLQASRPLGSAAGSGDFFIGQNTSGNRLKGSIAEFIAYSRALSDSEMDSIASYLKLKWNISDSPAPIVSPKNSVFDSSSGSLSATITTGTGGVTYFTTDGSDPRSSSTRTQYTVPITIASTTTLQAVTEYGTRVSAITKTLYQAESTSAAVPRTGLISWLKSDFGVIEEPGGMVSRWSNMAGDNDAVALSNGPVKTANALNGLPVIDFAGQKFMSFASGFSSFSGGSVFAVVKASNGPVLNISNSGTTDRITLSNSSNAASYSSGSSTMTGNNAFSPSEFKLVEVVQNGTSATIYSNASQLSQSSMQSISSVTRTGNFIGTNYAADSFSSPQIAELFIYDRALTSSEKLAIEYYVSQKYAIPSNPKLATPAITPPIALSHSGAPVVLTMTGPIGSEIRYTTDGTDPTTNSSLYDPGNKPSISNTSLIKAKAFQQYYRPSDIGTAQVNIDDSTSHVPTSQRILWLRADTGVDKGQASPFPVSRWRDVSGAGHDALAGSSPTFAATSSANSKPTIQFSVSGSNQYLSMPAGFSTFNGMTVFVVTKPMPTLTAGKRFLNFATGTLSSPTINNSFYISEGSPSQVNFSVLNGLSGQNLLTPANTMAANVYMIMDVVQTGSGKARFFKNSVEVSNSPGDVQNIPDVSRPVNTIGSSGSTGNFFIGEISEILMYSRALNDDERTAVESYLYSRYQIGTPPKAVAPTISPDSTVFASGQQQVTISSANSLPIVYSLDNGANWLSYTAPFNVGSSTKVRAKISGAPNYLDSDESVSFIQFDPLSESIPRNGLQAWMKADNGVITSGSAVSLWMDSSNNKRSAVPTGAPTFSSSAFSPLPGITLSGTGQYFSWPSNWPSFTSGETVLMLVKPTTFGASDRLLDFSNGANRNDSFYLMEGLSDTRITYGVYNGSAFTNLAAPVGSMIVGQPQLFEVVHRPDATATLHTVFASSDALPFSGTLPNITNVPRSNCRIGAYQAITASNFFQGSIAEILIYNRPLTENERIAAESYFAARYGLKPRTAIAPTILPASIVKTEEQTTFTITSPSTASGARIYMTLDGTTPTTSSTIYEGPFTLSGPATVKAFVAGPGWLSSAVSSSFVQVDPTVKFVPHDSSLLGWWKADNGLEYSGTVAKWFDSSGNNREALPSGTVTRVVDSSSQMPSVSIGSGSKLSISNVLPSLSSGTTIIAAVKPTGAGGTILGVGPASGVTNSMSLSQPNATDANLTIYSGSTIGLVQAPGATASNKFQILTALQSGLGTGAVSSNDIQIATGPLNNPPSVAQAINNIGAAANGTNSYAGEIAELLIYGRALSVSEQSNVYRYLANRYSKSFDAPSIAPPSGLRTSATTITITPSSGTRYTSDGSNPILGGTAYSGAFSVSSSTALNAANTVNPRASTGSYQLFDSDTDLSALNRTGMSLWLRADLGPQRWKPADTNGVTGWIDLSGQNNHGTTLGTILPEFSAAVANNNPIVSFPSNGVLALSPGFSNLSAGASLFLVCKLNDDQASGNLLELGNGASESLQLGLSNGGLTFKVYSGNTPASIISQAALTTTRFQLVEAISPSPGEARVFLNGALVGQGPVGPLSNLLRKGNGINLSGVNLADIAEVMVLARALNPVERATYEHYLFDRYAIATNRPPAPLITVPSATLAGPTLVAIVARAQSELRYTTDGSEPTAASTLYTGPINIIFSQTLKVIAVEAGVPSDIAFASYKLDPVNWPAPSSSPSPVLDFQLTLPTNAIQQP